MKTVRWGILGTGTAARQFTIGLRSVPDAQLIAVGSRTQETATAFAQTFSIPRAYGSYEVLVSDPDIDIVYIATTNNLHRDNCILCLNAGKAVLCEKPFALSAAEAHEVMTLARQKRLFCMEAMWMRFIPAMEQTLRLIQEGAIGEIRMIRAELGFPHMYKENNRLFNPDLGGGALLDLGVYPVSLVTQLLGMPSEILSQATIGATGVDEQAALLLSYQGGQLATISTTLHSIQGNDAMILGSRGQLYIHAPLFAPYRLTLRRFAVPTQTSRSKSSTLSSIKNIAAARNLYRRFEPFLAPLMRRGNKQIMIPFDGNGYHYEAAEATHCIQNGITESKIMPLDDTLHTMEIMDRAREQWHTRVPA